MQVRPDTRRETVSQSRVIRVAFVALVFAVHAPGANADDPAFQSLLSAACVNPQAELASRCGETFAGQGGISGASQSSLNPSQALSAPSGAAALGSERAGESRSRQDRHVDGEVAEKNALEFGRFSLILNARDVSQSFDAGTDPTSERAYDLSNRSVQAGLDYRMTRNSIIGAWVEWRDSELDFDRAAPVIGLTPDFDAGRVDSESLGGAIYAGIDVSDRAHLNLAIGYGDTDYEMERRALFEPLQAGNQPGPVTVVETRGLTSGSDRWATVNFGYRIDGENWSFDPYVGVNWSAAEVAGYIEEDLMATGLAMNVGRVESTSVTGIIGVDARRVVSLSSAVVIPQLHFEYEYGIDSDATEALASFLLDTDGGNQLVLGGDTPDKDAARVGLGLVAIFRDGWSVFVDVQTTVGARHIDRYTVAAGIRLEL